MLLLSELIIHKRWSTNHYIYLRAVYEHQERGSPLNRFLSWQGRVSKPGITACVTDKFFSFPLLASPPAALVHWGIFELIIKESGDEGSDGKGRKSVTSLSRCTFVPIIPLWHFSLVSLGLDCEAVGFFFLKISKEIGKAWRKSLTRAKRASLTRPSISLSLRRGL